MRVVSNDTLMISAKTRVTAQVFQPENSSSTTNASGNTSEDDEQVEVENNKREEKEKELKEKKTEGKNHCNLYLLRTFIKKVIKASKKARIGTYIIK